MMDYYDDGLDLREYARVARKLWWLFVAFPVLLVSIAVYRAYDQTDAVPEYRASATFLILGASPAGIYEPLVTMPSVLREATDAMSLPAKSLDGRVTTEVNGNYLGVNVVTRSPQLSATVAQAVAAVPLTRSQDIRTVELDALSAESSQNDSLRPATPQSGMVMLIEQASVPTSPVAVSEFRLTAVQEGVLAVLTGMMIAAALAGLQYLWFREREYLPFDEGEYDSDIHQNQESISEWAECETRRDA